MDYIIGLPRTGKMHDSIMVVVDKITKAAHFIPLKTTHKAADVADIFMKEVVRMHGIPKSPCQQGHVTQLDGDKCQGPVGTLGIRKS
jgi:hypothetical protein